MSHSKRTRWMRAFAELVDRGTATCPDCGLAPIRHRFVGNSETRTGFGLIWCDSCETGIHISRLTVAERFELRSFNDRGAMDDVPDFKRH